MLLGGRTDLHRTGADRPAGPAAGPRPGFVHAARGAVWSARRQSADHRRGAGQRDGRFRALRCRCDAGRDRSGIGWGMAIASSPATAATMLYRALTGYGSFTVGTRWNAAMPPCPRDARRRADIVSACGGAPDGAASTCAQKSSAFRFRALASRGLLHFPHCPRSPAHITLGQERPAAPEHGADTLPGEETGHATQGRNARAALGGTTMDYRAPVPIWSMSCAMWPALTTRSQRGLPSRSLGGARRPDFWKRPASFAGDAIAPLNRIGDTNGRNSQRAW